MFLRKFSTIERIKYKMKYSVKIYDSKGDYIAENMKASVEDVRKYLDKGFQVKDIHTKEYLDMSIIMESEGVSDGVID
jgi:NMD protein affecting ribosome stability and mRNA decay